MAMRPRSKVLWPRGKTALVQLQLWPLLWRNDWRRRHIAPESWSRGVNMVQPGLSHLVRILYLFLAVLVCFPYFFYQQVLHVSSTTKAKHASRHWWNLEGRTQRRTNMIFFFNSKLNVSFGRKDLTTFPNPNILSKMFALSQTRKIQRESWSQGLGRQSWLSTEGSSVDMAMRNLRPPTDKSTTRPLQSISRSGLICSINLYWSNVWNVQVNN